MAQKSVQSTISKIKIGGAIQRFFGWIVAILCSLCVILSLSIENGIVGVVIFSLGALIGFSGVASGRKKKKLLRDFQSYSAILAGDSVKSIDFLAASLGISREIAVKNLSLMIAKGLFPNAYIDKQSNCLMFFDGKQPPKSESYVEFVTVQCPGCGAPNKVISGTVGECEYCGVPLDSSQQAPLAGKSEK